MPALFDESLPAAPGAPDRPPLAERLRARTFDELVGLDEVLVRGRRLRALAAPGRLPSLIFWGPPGCGKTTLARLLAAAGGAEFTGLSAVNAGVKEVRAAVTRARALGAGRRRLVLFLDEIHRFNKAQQDALLPVVEDGTLVLLGATTENPSFEVNAALLSRCQVVVLPPLARAAVGALIDRAAADPDRGLAPPVPVADEARAALIALAAGDARSALTLLETAHALALADGAAAVTVAHVEAAAARPAARHDKHGEQHYDLISAFIKSLRASHVDAALYWLARMVAGGEDPVFIARRMVIFASEDVGNADPRALTLAVAAMEAVRLIGYPECHFALSQGASYLALAPKSNAQLDAIRRAKEAVLTHGPLPVPLALRNAPTRLMEELGYGTGYQNAHHAADGVARMPCLPDELALLDVYLPGDRGFERPLGERLAWWRAQHRGTEAPKTPPPPSAGES